MISNINAIKINLEDTLRWNELLFSSINSSYISSIPYEYSQISNGRSISTFIFNLNSEDIAWAHYSLKKSYKGIIKVADILSWFVFKTEPTEELLSFLINHFLNWSKQNKASIARIVPWLPKLLLESILNSKNYLK